MHVGYHANALLSRIWQKLAQKRVMNTSQYCTIGLCTGTKEHTETFTTAIYCTSSLFCQRLTMSVLFSISFYFAAQPVTREELFLRGDGLLQRS